ncbi:hypothetical protein [Bradyrhizobium sp. 138]|uniref:hypothetical protein n=1 Tax=Bradyrhizobium sp. 138 TaxID=2782615 RepID=UPI003209F3A8
MKQYVGLDISMEDASICVLDQNSGVTFEGCVPSDPEAIAKLLRQHAGNAERLVFEKPARYQIGFGISSGRWAFRLFALMRVMPTQRYRCASTSRTRTMPRDWPKWPAWDGTVKLP